MLLSPCSFRLYGRLGEGLVDAVSDVKASVRKQSVGFCAK
jgi:hypothetical protein